MEPVKIRGVVSEDAPSVAYLAAQLGYPVTADEMPLRLDAIAADQDHCVLVAECCGVVIGWIHVYVRKTLAREGDAEIGGLIVDEAHRGRSIGRQLVANALTWAKAQECRTTIVRSNVIREKSTMFYTSLGFSEVKTQSVFRLILNDWA